MLTDVDLKRLINVRDPTMAQSAIGIKPYDEECLTPVGYDLRVGTYYISIRKGAGFEVEPKGRISIAPGDTVLIDTLEDITMPRDGSLSGLITSRVSVVSRGLSHISTNVDPDWVGTLSIAVTNLSRSQITLEWGEQLCSLIFFRNVSPSTTPSNHNPGRHRDMLRMLSRRRRERRWRNIAKEAPPIIITLLFGAIGYWQFGNAPGFAAFVALGVAISQAVAAILRSRG